MCLFKNEEGSGEVVSRVGIVLLLYALRQLEYDDRAGTRVSIDSAPNSFEIVLLSWQGRTWHSLH